MNATAFRTTAFRTIARVAATTAAVATMTVTLAGTSFADGPGTLAGNHTGGVRTTLTLEGSVSGPLDNAKVTCNELGDKGFSWTAKGTVDGTPVEITFNTNHFDGPGNYNTTGITDEFGGLATLTAGAGDVVVASNNSTEGIFTIRPFGPPSSPGSTIGSIETTLENAPYNKRVHVEGVWNCG